MILVLLGPPGVGKGTQGARIAVHYDLPTISTGAAISNAVANAIGVRVPELPLTADRVLAALEKGRAA